jgi:Cu+-exporting ATPase
LVLAAAAEATSEHPLAQAVVKTAFERGAVLPEIEAFDAHPGEGVAARIGGKEVLVGNPRFLGGCGVDLDRLKDRIETLEIAGRTVIAVAREGRAIGVIGLGDRR